MTKELCGHTPAAEFGPLALRAIQEHMATSPGVDRRTGRPLSYARGTINSTCGCIKRMFKWAVSQGCIPVPAPAFFG